MKEFDPRIGSEIVAEELDERRKRIIVNMQREGAVATGNTIRSLRVEQRPFGAALISAQRMPFGVLETGRRGGNVPQPVIHGVPVGFAAIIYRWMQAKGIHATDVRKPPSPRFVAMQNEQEKADRSLSFAIATSIMKRGTKLFREGGRDTIYSREIPKTIDKVRERLSRLISAEVLEQIKLNTQTLNQ